MDNTELIKWLIDVSLTMDSNKKESKLMLKYAINKLKKQCTTADVGKSVFYEDGKLINNMCLSYRHDFGLLNLQEKSDLVNECKNWLIALDNNTK